MIGALPFFGEAHVSWSLPIALAAAFLTWLMLFKTPLGFEMRAVGQSERAAITAGIPVQRIQIIAMSIAGALAACVGLGEVLGNAGRFRVGFSPDFGFLGIAVALMGRNHPFGIVLSALLLAALHKGAADLDLETEHVTRELSLLMQALIILSVSAEALWSWTRRPKT
jgi:simple sugar transport system permease protein